MNIVIIGAGTLGTYIASLLAQEEHNVTLIDTDETVLQEAAWKLDVGTKKGSATDWQLIDDLLEFQPDILIALTGIDETNMVACSLAKHMGFPRTICRVKDSCYLNKNRLDFSRIFGVDHFICPELLVAQDIMKRIRSPGSRTLDYFAHGAVQMRTLVIPQRWRDVNQPLKDLSLPEGVMLAIVKTRYDEKGIERKPPYSRVIFPHGDDIIYPGDEVTLIGESETMTTIHHFFNIEQKEVKSVVIVGGSQTTINLAEGLAGREIDVRIIEKDFSRCSYLAEKLPFCTIMHHDGSDLNFLLSEKIGRADAFISCTGTDEVNLFISSLGKQAGCENVIAVLKNRGYSSVVDRLEISHAISPYSTSANHILSLALSISVSSLISLYEHEAEIIEVSVSNQSKIVGIPLSELGPLLPKEFLICMIQNRGQIMIAHGNRIISPGDTVVVACHPKHFQELENIF